MTSAELAAFIHRLAYHQPPARLEVVVLVGIQASGKTTFALRYLAATHVHISKDHWGRSSGKPVRQARAIDAALAAGSSVVVDNTNPTRQDRQPILEAASAYRAAPIAVVFDLPLHACLARNAQREGRARVPDLALRRVARILEPPTIAEGFTHVWRARPLDQGRFALRPAHPDEPDKP